MSFSNQNLRKSTIFDLTTDTDIIVGEFGILESAEDYNKIVSIKTRIKDFLDLSELTNDSKLKEAVYKQFKEELLVFGF
ncbi:hypothetical protein N9609_00555 [bacterium]|nr:hypothetical protein [bacterium]